MRDSLSETGGNYEDKYMEDVVEFYDNLSGTPDAFSL
jgi:hypothetical protein